MSEECVRCGEVGEDRRTLWMSCFYNMNELDVPFEEHPLFRANLEDIKGVKKAAKIEIESGKEIVLSPGKVRCNGELTPHKLFTLRVCKECRGSWMGMIENWFKSVRTPIADEEIGSGIFIREHGATVEISEEEWYKRYPGKEPVRLIKDGDEGV